MIKVGFGTAKLLALSLFVATPGLLEVDGSFDKLSAADPREGRCRWWARHHELRATPTVVGLELVVMEGRFPIPEKGGSGVAGARLSRALPFCMFIGSTTDRTLCEIPPFLAMLAGSELRRGKPAIAPEFAPLVIAAVL